VQRNTAAVVGVAVAVTVVVASVVGPSASPRPKAGTVLCFDTTVGPKTLPEVCVPDPLGART
jgi:hypothetical protein